MSHYDTYRNKMLVAADAGNWESLLNIAIQFWCPFLEGYNPNKTDPSELNENIQLLEMFHGILEATACDAGQCGKE